jgi:hypothetical protein
MDHSHSNGGFGSASTVFIFLLVSVFLVTLHGACGVKKGGEKSVSAPDPPKPTTPPTDEKPVPAELMNAGELGENIYDAAKTSDWKTAEERLVELNAAAGKMADSGISSQRFEETLKRLGEAARGKQARETLIESNLITLEIAQISSNYNTPVPVAVTKLDFYGRELEIWSAANDDKRLKDTAALIRETWNAVRPEVEKAGGAKEANDFESLVANLERAKNAEDFGKSATPILDEVDNLENVFSR